MGACGGASSKTGPPKSCWHSNRAHNNGRAAASFPLGDLRSRMEKVEKKKEREEVMEKRKRGELMEKRAHLGQSILVVIFFGYQ